mgnify:CR=1 FL=1
MEWHMWYQTTFLVKIYLPIPCLPSHNVWFARFRRIIARRLEPTTTAHTRKVSPTKGQNTLRSAGLSTKRVQTQNAIFPVSSLCALFTGDTFPLPVSTVVWFVPSPTPSASPLRDHRFRTSMDLLRRRLKERSYHSSAARPQWSGKILWNGGGKEPTLRSAKNDRLWNIVTKLRRMKIEAKRLKVNKFAWLGKPKSPMPSASPFPRPSFWYIDWSTVTPTLEAGR